MSVIIEWTLGLGLMFGLALIFNSFTLNNLIGFLAFLTIFNGFVCWAGLLPLWTLVLNVVSLTIIIYYKSTKRGLI